MQITVYVLWLMILFCFGKLTWRVLFGNWNIGNSMYCGIETRHCQLQQCCVKANWNSEQISCLLFAAGGS
uniref:Uncharacterized protein n=1 Tax=Arundo donax TaxID=35708 RepID=A0A0A9B9K7_ARUDO